MNNQQPAFNFAATFDTMLEHIDQLEAERPPASFLQTLEKYLELTDQDPEKVYKSLESVLNRWYKCERIGAIPAPPPTYNISESLSLIKNSP